MMGPTKRAADMDDLMNLETQLMRLQEENARLRSILRVQDGQCTECARLRVALKQAQEPSIYGAPDAEHVLIFKEAIVQIEDEESRRKPGTQMTLPHLDACTRMVRSAVLIAKSVARHE
jgi:hypothetical protein